MEYLCNNAVSLYKIDGCGLSFHQTGPLMISIKGGIDSDEENKGILISGIREGGAAHQYSERHTPILTHPHTHMHPHTPTCTHIHPHASCHTHT